MRVAPGASLLVHDCAISNAGCEMVEIDPEAPPEDVPAAVAIRGYRLKQLEVVRVDILDPGEYELVGAGELRRMS